jgi:hypothetical protein
MAKAGLSSFGNLLQDGSFFSSVIPDFAGITACGVRILCGKFSK